MSASPALVPVEVRGLLQDPANRSPILILKETGGERFLPIWIGLFEAQAIALALEGIAAPRPLTHDLLAAALDACQVTVERVVVSDLREGTFFATVELLREQGPLALDARPSDAVALGLRCRAPLFVDERVFAAARHRRPEGEEEAESEEERIRKLLESLAPEDLGRYKM
ncbi:MAG TPA: bifunctional nuclease family protein [Thermoanaerobaculia bacterium]|nr:bifunctional nuclease family protein [Thermoanaerobaculia bacterium]